MKELFRRFAGRTAEAVGTPAAFAIALISIGLWAMTGPFFHFSDTWQLIINTGTTIITFLMVFLIQNSQNRDTRAIHLKLNELIKGVRGARTEMVNLEDMSDAELQRMHDEFKQMHEQLHKKAVERGLPLKKTPGHTGSGT
jgi:low affinity Fe/Cu permease